MKKKCEMNELVISQLKKELEKYAYELLRLQEKSKMLMGNTSDIVRETDDEDDDDGWH